MDKPTLKDKYAEFVKKKNFMKDLNYDSLKNEIDDYLKYGNVLIMTE